MVHSGTLCIFFFPFWTRLPGQFLGRRYYLPLPATNSACCRQSLLIGPIVYLPDGSGAIFDWFPSPRLRWPLLFLCFPSSFFILFYFFFKLIIRINNFGLRRHQSNHLKSNQSIYRFIPQSVCCFFEYFFSFFFFLFRRACKSPCRLSVSQVRSELSFQTVPTFIFPALYLLATGFSYLTFSCLALLSLLIILPSSLFLTQV